ncbi:MAG TPA: TlpA disulfide reductase family protein [Gemmatimonadales bacterium]|nr:TlpA disulfide reductase family protein [Gemmatimonadales bacterium]
MRLAGTAMEAMVLLCMLSGQALAAPTVGSPAPPLVVLTLDGTRFDLSTLRGRVVVVNLWATWCPPCREELPALDEFYSRHHAEGVEVLGLSLDRKRDRKDVLSAARGLHYPVAFASDAERNGFGAPSMLPVTYVIGPDGMLRAVFLPTSPKLSVESIEAAARPLLPDAPPTSEPRAKREDSR